MSLSEGTKAPDFTLSDQNGHEHDLSDYRGHWVLLYFYPKDDTPGCTTEACGIRDSYAAFAKNNITVIGISADPVASHKKFADKYDLPFLILSDESKEVIENYEAWGEKKFMGRTYMGIFRISYLINPEAIIIKVYPKVKPAEHAAEVLKDVEGYQK